MNRTRRNRLLAVGFLVAGAGATVGLVLTALSENINLFYPPDQVVGGGAPLETRIRAGGMVDEGSVRRIGEGLTVEFVLTDYRGSSFPVRYTGILPDLFREGQGILVQGELQDDGLFLAREVLAKHDETYMPPEIAHLGKPAAAGDLSSGMPVPPGGAPAAAVGAPAVPASQMPEGTGATVGELQEAMRRGAGQ